MAFDVFAFPRPGDSYSQSDSQDGMTLRQYFAARAPSIPAWFEPTMREQPKAPPPTPVLDGIPIFADNEFARPGRDMEALSRRNYIINTACSWQRDPHWDLPLEDGQYPDATAADVRGLWDAARPALRAFVNAWQEYWAANAAWECDERRERVAQWPWAWADLVLGAQK